MIQVALVCLQFVLIFAVVYFGQYFFIYRKEKKYDRKKCPLNVKYLVNKYNLDVVRIGYKRILKTLMVCDAFMVALIFTVTIPITNIYIRLAAAFCFVIPTLAVVYHIVATYYKKEID